MIADPLIVLLGVQYRYGMPRLSV